MLKYLAAVIAAMVATSALAVPLNLNNPNGIAAIYTSSENSISAGAYFIVCTDGNGYYCDSGLCGQGWVPFIAAPVPLAQVSDWTPWLLTTFDGRWFIRSAVADHIQWQQLGVDGFGNPPVPPCAGPVKTDQAPMGKVKALFR
jgi:hypothetical protein